MNTGPSAYKSELCSLRCSVVYLSSRCYPLSAREVWCFCFLKYGEKLLVFVSSNPFVCGDDRSWMILEGSITDAGTDLIQYIIFVQRRYVFCSR